MGFREEMEILQMVIMVVVAMEIILPMVKRSKKLPWFWLEIIQHIDRAILREWGREVK